MEINFIGFASAAATFLGVWVGHVAVRKIERDIERLWIPSIMTLLLGVGLEIASLIAASQVLSTICGIVGVTLLWDALEFYRQQKRIKKGHAPANSNNPRHARILEAHPDATTFDWLARDPCGMPYSSTELDLTKQGTI